MKKVPFERSCYGGSPKIILIDQKINLLCSCSPKIAIVIIESKFRRHFQFRLVWFSVFTILSSRKAVFSRFSLSIKKINQLTLIITGLHILRKFLLFKKLYVVEINVNGIKMIRITEEVRFDGLRNEIKILDGYYGMHTELVWLLSELLIEYIIFLY